MKRVEHSLAVGMLVILLALASSACGGHKDSQSQPASGLQSENRKEDDFTPLMKAAVDLDVAAVRRLLREGAQVNVSDADGYTPLHYAVHCGEIEIVQMLLDAGADVKAATKQGVTPLSYSIDMMCPNPEITLALIRAGANVNAADKDGNTPLYIATTESSLEVMEELLKRGADPNFLTKTIVHGPLHIAALNGLVEEVELLLRYGADPKKKNAQGQTAIDLANKRYPELRRLLENAGGR